MMSLYLPKPSRFRKRIVYILLVGNQWTSLCNVIMLHVNIFPYIFRVLHIPHICESLSANSIPIISKWKKITQLFILILVLLILNTSCICNISYFSKISCVWYSEIMWFGHTMTEVSAGSISCRNNFSYWNIKYFSKNK